MAKKVSKNKTVRKVAIGTAVIGACAAATILTGGACASVAGAVAAGALKGAVLGAASGAVTGGVVSAAKYAVENKTLAGSAGAIAEGMASGYASGAISGAISGAVGGFLKGTQFGRKKLEIPDAFENCYSRWDAGELSIRQGAAELGVSHTNFYRWCKVRKQTMDQSVSEGRHFDTGDL